MRTYYSPEERAAYNAQKEAEADARIQTLAENWNTRPEDVAEYLRFRQQFHQYSSRNLMLMYAQNPNATYVGSFSRFQELGYAINRGEHGMSIQAPIVKEYYRTSPTSAWRPLNKDTPPEDRRMARVAAYETQQRVIGYRTTTVFDITQTTCPIEDYPKLLGMGYNSEHHAAIYREMCEISAQVGFPVTETQLPVGLRGQCGAREIRINQMLGDTQKLDTLFHEQGHGLLGHLSNSSLSTARKEFEADAFSILMSHRYGVEVTDARKDHLAAHYKNYCQEIRDAGGEVDITAIMAPVNRQYTMLEERLEKRLDVALGRGNSPAQEEAPPLEDKAIPVSRVGAAFEAEEMTQEKLAAICQRELSPYFENYNFRELKMPASVGGRFRNCTFSDCDFRNSEVHATFDHCSIYDAETNNATFRSAAFQHCTIANTQFRNVHLNEVLSAQTAYRHCSFVQTKLDGMFFEGGSMDNVYFHHDVEVRNVSGIDTLQMTMGGATSKEVENHVRQIKDALTFGTLPAFDMMQEVEIDHDRLFLDMDGTLAQFHAEDNYLERMWEPGFFEGLKPYGNAVDGLRQFMLQHPDTEVYILSSAIQGEPPSCGAQKNAWLDKHLPEIDAAHRIFPPVGEDKTAYIPGGVRATDHLLDDYNKNLAAWREAGGHAIKFVNHINDRGLIGERWDGDRVWYDKPAASICADLSARLWYEAAVELPPPKQTVVVNMFGGPGAGKTTCAWEIAEKLKKMGYVAEYVGEYAKELVWEGRTEQLDGSPQNQQMVYAEQKRRVDRLIGKVDFVVTDSPTLLNPVYLAEPDATYEARVLEDFNRNNNFCVFIERDESRFETAGRIHDVQQSRALDESIKSMLERNNVYYGTYRHDSIDQLIRNMEKTYRRFNPEAEIAPSATPSTEVQPSLADQYRAEATELMKTAVPEIDPTEAASICADLSARLWCEQPAMELSTKARPSPAPATSGRNYYDDDAKERIKAVPLEQLCSALGIETKRSSGSRLVCKIRDEKTSSCTLYPDNSFYDFGISEGGDNIRFVQLVKGCDFNDACDFIARQGGISPSKPSRKSALHRANEKPHLSDQEYALIGINAAKATANFNLNVARYGAKSTAKFIAPYEDLTVQELRDQYPDVYTNVLKQRAIPFVYDLRNEYFRSLHSSSELARAVGSTLEANGEILQDLTKLGNELRQAEYALKDAAKGCDLKVPKPGDYDPVRDLADIESGKRQFEIGSVPYVELKKELGTDNRVAFQKVPYEDYRANNALADVRHAAFYQAGMVNVVYDRSQHKKLFPNMEISPLKEERKVGKHDPVQEQKRHREPDKEQKDPVRGKSL